MLVDANEMLLGAR